MSFDVNWDIDKHKEDHESDNHWQLRRNYMQRYPEEVMQEVAVMSKEVNKHPTCSPKPGMNSNFSSNTRFSGGPMWRSYTIDDLQGAAENPSFVENVDSSRSTEQPHFKVSTSYAAATEDNTWSSNQNLVGDGEHVQEQLSNDAMQEPASMLQTAYSDSFVPTTNQMPEPNMQQTRDVDTTLSGLNKLSAQNNTQNPVAAHNNTSWQNRDPRIKGMSNTSNNAYKKVVPAAKRKRKMDNPADPRLVLNPKEPTFTVKMFAGNRIAKQVIRISYRKSLKNTVVFTIGRNGGVCRKPLSEGKRKRAVWWVDKGKTVEEALLLCLRPYHEIYEEILNGNHSWGTPMTISNLLEQINKEGVYNPYIARPQADDSEASIDNLDKEKEQFSEDESSQGLPSTSNPGSVQPKSENSNHPGLPSSMLSQDPNHSISSQHEVGSQNISYCPQGESVSSRPDPCGSLPVHSRPVPEFMPESYNPSDKIINKKSTNKMRLKKEITGAAHRRYQYWRHLGKTIEESKALCVIRMNKIPMYKEFKATVGSLGSFIKTRQRNISYGKNECEKLNYTKAPSGAYVIQGNVCQQPQSRDKVESCDNVNNFPIAQTNNRDKIPNQSKSQDFLKEIEKINNSKIAQNKIIDPVAIDRYRWWRYVGKSVSQAWVMCQKPLQKFPNEHKEGVKIIDFRTYILREAAKNKKALAPLKFLNGPEKVRYTYWINMGKTKEVALKLTEQGSYKARVKRMQQIHLDKQEKLKKDIAKLNEIHEMTSKLWSSGHSDPAHTLNSQNTSGDLKIPNFETPPAITEVEDLTKNADLITVDCTNDNESNIHIEVKEDNIKKKVEPATELTETENLFECWKEQGKTVEALKFTEIDSNTPSNRIPSYNEGKDSVAQNEGNQSDTSDLREILQRKEMRDKQNFKSIDSDMTIEISRSESFGVCKNLMKSKKDQFKVCIKANTQIRQNELDAIKNSLNQCIADEGGINITNVKKKSDHVIITCPDEQTRDWLDKQIPTLVPWENAQLTIVDENEVPCNIMVRFLIPIDTEIDSSSALAPAQLKQQLHELNPDVGCNKWMVHKSLPQTDPYGVYIMAGIDRKSNDVLKSRQKSLKWLDGQHIKITIQEKKDSKQKRAEYNHRAVFSIPRGPVSKLPGNKLLNKLHRLNPDVGCAKWQIDTIKVHQDGAVLLVRFNNGSKGVLKSKQNILKWFGPHRITVTIIPVYVNIELPVNKECKHLRKLPLSQIAKTIVKDLNLFNPGLGCLKWHVFKIQDMVDAWYLNIKINAESLQILKNRDYKLNWYGGRLAKVDIAENVPELDIFNQVGSDESATSVQQQQKLSRKQLKRIKAQAWLNSQMTENEKITMQETTNSEMPSSVHWSNPALTTPSRSVTTSNYLTSNYIDARRLENPPDITLPTSSRQVRTTESSRNDFQESVSSRLERNLVHGNETDPCLIQDHISNSKGEISKHYDSHNHNRRVYDSPKLPIRQPPEYVCQTDNNQSKDPHNISADIINPTRQSDSRENADYYRQENIGDSEWRRTENEQNYARYQGDMTERSHVRQYDDGDRESHHSDGRNRFEWSTDAAGAVGASIEHRNVKHTDDNNYWNQIALTKDPLYRHEIDYSRKEMGRYSPRAFPEDRSNPVQRTEYIRPNIEQRESHYYGQPTDFRKGSRDREYATERRNYDEEERNYYREERQGDSEEWRQDKSCVYSDNRFCQETDNFPLGHQEKWGSSREDQWGRNIPFLRPEHRAALNIRTEYPRPSEVNNYHAYSQCHSKRRGSKPQDAPQTKRGRRRRRR